MHTIGAPRNVTKVKFHKTYPMELEPVQGQEAQSDETGGDTGAIREAKPKAILICLRQAPEHYKPLTLKAINYIYVICIVALTGRSWLETLAVLYHS
jgi:hypothetical protein